MRAKLIPESNILIISDENKMNRLTIEVAVTHFRIDVKHMQFILILEMVWLAVWLVEGLEARRQKQKRRQ